MRSSMDKSIYLEQLVLGISENKDEEIETYTMIDRSQQHNQQVSNTQKNERILCVKRIDLMFDNHNCQAISFTDISSYALLR